MPSLKKELTELEKDIEQMERETEIDELHDEEIPNLDVNKNFISERGCIPEDVWIKLRRL